MAVWSVTSAKPGNGVELLRDGRDDTYWQSDGAQPHLVNVAFQKKVAWLHRACCLSAAPMHPLHRAGASRYWHAHHRHSALHLPLQLPPAAALVCVW